MMVVMTSWAPVAALSQPAIDAHSAPASMPAISASGRWIKNGRPSKAKPTTTAAMPPISSCPSAPMLNSPARNPSAIPNPASVSGAAAVNVSDSALTEPTEPARSEAKDRPMVARSTPVASMVRAPRNSAMITAKIGTTTISSISKRVTTARFKSSLVMPSIFSLVVMPPRPLRPSPGRCPGRWPCGPRTPPPRDRDTSPGCGPTGP